MRLSLSARLALLLAGPAGLAGCITEDMIEGRRWPGDRPAPERHETASRERDYALRYCEDVINSDAYIECRREIDDARREAPARRRDPGGLPATPVSAAPP
jgi:hypothetical protein